MRHLLDTYALARPEVRLQCEYVSKQLTPPSPSKSPFTKPPITHLSQPLTTLSFSVDQRQHLLHSNLTLVLGLSSFFFFLIISFHVAVGKDTTSIFLSEHGLDSFFFRATVNRT